MLGFAPASVAASRTSSADVAANTGGSDGFTFDRAGNIWVLGGTTADPPLARYPRRAVRVRRREGSGRHHREPVVRVVSIPGPKVVAFDPAGNLWVSVVAEDKVVMFTAAQVAAGGTPTATVERRASSARRASRSTALETCGWRRRTRTPWSGSTKDHLAMSGDAEDLGNRGGDAVDRDRRAEADQPRVRRGGDAVGELRRHHRRDPGRRPARERVPRRSRPRFRSGPTC